MKAFANKLKKKRDSTLRERSEKCLKKTTKGKEDNSTATGNEHKDENLSDTSARSTPTATPKTRRKFFFGKAVFSASPLSTRKNTNNSSASTTSSPTNSTKFLQRSYRDEVSSITGTSTSSVPSLHPCNSLESQMTSLNSENSFTDYLSSFSRDELTDSFTSLSLENSPKASTLSRSMTSNQFALSLTEEKLSNLNAVTEAAESTTAPPSKVWGKRFKFPFRSKEKLNEDKKKRRVSNGDIFQTQKEPKQFRTRSQSLCVGDLGKATQILEKFQEDNEALELEVRGKEEELRLLNATIDQVNQTWEEKVEAMMKDLENAKRKNEHLRHILSKESAVAQANAQKPAVRVPLRNQLRNSRLADVQECEQESTSNELKKTCRHPCGDSLISPPAKRKGVREAPKQLGGSVRPSAKTDDIKEKLRLALTSSKCLSKLSREEILSIVAMMKCKRINKGERLMQEGHVGQAFYILAEGACRIYKLDQESASPDLSEVGRPVNQWEIFGEADVFYHTRRVWSCKCVRPGLVWYITKDDFKSAVMKQDIRQRKKEMYGFLKSIKRFEKLCTSQLRMLTNIAKVVQYAEGDCIIRQGSHSKCAYIVKEGEVTITKLVDGTETPQKALGVGELFGENGTADCSKINVVATGNEVVQCILIPLKHFNRIREYVTTSSEEVTASTITKSLAERKRKEDGQESTASGYTADTSSGYASDINSSEGKRKVEGKRYDAKHSKKFWERVNHLKGVDENSFQFIATIGNGAFGSVDLVASKADAQDVVAIKKLSKREIVSLDQQQNVQSERNLQMITSRDCPFIVSLYASFKDDKYVYFVMEYCAGGELFSLLIHTGPFIDAAARFYVACVLEALIFLHSKHIVFRDLKPENVVIDKDGYCKLTDFGFAKKVSVNSALRTYTYCGTPEYMAPEVVLHHAQSFPVDLWSLGVFIFEILDGKAPFRNKNRAILAETILRGMEPKLKIAREGNRINATASNLIKELCQTLPEDRLGSGKNGISNVAMHSWFCKMDWKALRQRKLQPPWKPRLDNIYDLRYFKTHSKSSCSYEHQEQFSKWDETFQS